MRFARPVPILAAALLAVALSSPLDGWAARPLDTEDTGTLDPGQFELELGGDFERTDTENSWGATLVVAAGIVPRLEARFEVTGLVLDPRGQASERGFGDSVFGLKYRVRDEGDVAPALLAALALRLPTGDPDRGLGAEGVDVNVLAAAGKTLGPVTLNANVGYAFATADRDLDAWILAASVQYQLTPAWTLVAETVNTILPRGADTAVLRGGATWTVHEGIRLDAAVGAGLTPSSPDVTVTVGMTVSWGSAARP